VAERPGAARGALTLAESATLLGQYQWIEQRLYELTGRWSGESSVPAVQLYLDELSAQHGWHAGLWDERLPIVDGLDRRAPGGHRDSGARLLLDAVGADEPAPGDGPVRTLRRMAGLCRVVLPRLIVTYDRHLARAVPVADGPVTRVLRLVVRDEVEAWQAGEALVERLLVTADDVAAATAAQQRLEALVVGAGVRSGLVPWPATGTTDRST